MKLLAYCLTYSMVFILFLFSSRTLSDHLILITHKMKGFPGRSVVKNLPAMPVTWVRSLGREDPLKKEVATHSGILAWKIPWTEEPGRLQSMRLQESDMT